MAKFEKVSRFNEIDLSLPIRKTAESAGYDFVVAEDIIIPPYCELVEKMKAYSPVITPTLDIAAAAIKAANAKVSLVSTGMKCQLEKGTYLELSVRSSCPLKHWLILGNSVGIIDADYYNNPDNEGEIFFQIINLAPFPIYLKRGDAIGQGIIKPYLTVEGDHATGTRVGGFGSTDGHIISHIGVDLNQLNGINQYDMLGHTSHAENAQSIHSYAEGVKTWAAGQYSHAEGYQNR